MPLKPLSADRQLLAYVVGLAVGNGNLSRLRRTLRLRITCDTKYPKLIRRIQDALQELLPANKVSLVPRKRNCVDITCYHIRLARDVAAFLALIGAEKA